MRGPSTSVQVVGTLVDGKKRNVNHQPWEPSKSRRTMDDGIGGLVLHSHASSSSHEHVSSSHEPLSTVQESEWTDSQLEHHDPLHSLASLGAFGDSNVPPFSQLLDM